MAQSPVASKHCLVLDDEFLIALDIQDILTHAGAADVVCVSQAKDALKAIEARTFDIAVLDVMLGGKDLTSLPVAEALTAKNIPFVFLTGMRAGDGHTAKFPNAPTIEKPYEPRILLATIERALEGNR